LTNQTQKYGKSDSSHLGIEKLRNNAEVNRLNSKTMVDLKHLTEKGNKRCLIGKHKLKLSIAKPSCVGANNQCNNQLLRQKCKNLWSEAIRIADTIGFEQALIYLKRESKLMKGWFI